VAEAVTRTTSGSTLPEAEQDQLLAQSCAEACDLLKDWLNDPWWERTRPADDSPAKEHVPTQKEFAKFLGPMLRDSLIRASQCGMKVDESMVDQAREKVAATTRRFPRMGRQQLFEEARRRVGSLQQEVCGLADQMRSAAHLPAAPAPQAVWRRKARKALGKVSGVLLAVTLAMGGASPHAVAENTAAWGQAAARTVEVITVHYLADRAEPGAHVAPSRAGPRLR
jgi:hypothetical protein